jgi:hypothetical protein
VHRSLRQKKLRFDKVVNGLVDLCSRKNLKETITVNDNRLIIRASRPKLWETLLYPTPIIALWAWYFIDKSKDDFGFLALLGLTFYWIWLYLEIAKGLNQIAVYHDVDEVEIVNLDRIGRYFYKPVLFKIDPENRVFEKEKRFSRLNKTNRISVQTNSGKLTLIDIDDFFASNRFKFALTYLLTTKHTTQ